MLTLDELRTWLTAAPQSVTEPVKRDVMPDKPDVVVVLSNTGGLELETEDAIDNPTVQVRCRGPSAEVVETLAFRLDGLLLKSGPFSIGSTHVVSTGRLGGRPGYIGTDDRGRTIYSANYWFKSER